VRTFALSIAAGMMILGTGPARAAQQADGPPQVWRLEWANPHCTITTGESSTFLLSLWMMPGSPDPDLYLTGPTINHYTVGGALVLLGRGHGDFTGQLISRQNKSGVWVLDIVDLGQEFPSALSGATQVQVALRENVKIPVKGAGEAIAALRECLDDKLAAWGIDAKAYDSLRTPPIDPYPHLHWLSRDDFPDDAKKEAFEGNAVARVNVDAGGKVTGCAIVVSTGIASLDKATCAKTLQKGKFKPAIGGDGHPVAATRTILVKFNADWDKIRYAPPPARIR